MNTRGYSVKYDGSTDVGAPIKEHGGVHVGIYEQREGNSRAQQLCRQPPLRPFDVVSMFSPPQSSSRSDIFLMLSGFETTPKLSHYRIRFKIMLAMTRVSFEGVW